MQTYLHQPVYHKVIYFSFMKLKRVSECQWNIHTASLFTYFYNFLGNRIGWMNVLN